MNSIYNNILKQQKSNLLLGSRLSLSSSSSIIRQSIGYNRSSISHFSSSSSNKDEKPLSPSLVEQYNLTSPSRWVPITVVGFGTAFGTGLMHLNEEVQILGLFVLFVGTLYTKGGDALGKMLDESADAILREHNALEDAQIEATKQVISAYKRQMDIANDINSIFSAQRALMQKVVHAQSLRLQHDVRNQIVKRLDNLAAAEASVVSSIQSTLVSTASSKARSAFSAEKGDAALKSKVLESALLALESPGKVGGKDLVGDLFQSHFSKFKQTLEKSRGVEMSLSAEDYQSVSDSVKAVARRDGIDHIPINVPQKYKLDGIL